jgi:hypothetical protein
MLSGSMSVLCRGAEIQHKNCDNASTWSWCRPRGNCMIFDKEIVGANRCIWAHARGRRQFSQTERAAGSACRPPVRTRLPWGSPQTHHRAAPELAISRNLVFNYWWLGAPVEPVPIAAASEIGVVQLFAQNIEYVVIDAPDQKCTNGSHSICRP